MTIKSIIKSIIFLIAWSIMATNSFGHSKSESYSNWTVLNKDITGIITIPSHEVTRLPLIKQNNNSLSSSFLEHAKNNVRVFSEQTICSLGPSNILKASEGFIRIELQFNCPQTPPTKIDYRAIFELSPFAYSLCKNLLSRSADLGTTCKEYFLSLGNKYQRNGKEKSIIW